MSPADSSAPLGSDAPSDLWGDFHRRILDSLDAAIYATGPDGAIIYYNDAAARLWGRRPTIGRDRWCGSWRLYTADGEPMEHSACPMAETIRKRRPIAGAEAVAQRPNGELVAFMAFPTPLFDAEGLFTGAANLLVDITERKDAEAAAQQLAAIVESSEDAILTKDLDGVITSWNEGARRLFGYSAAEAVGRSITMLIPPDRLDEEPVILKRIRNGQRVEHYETVRRRKDGSLIDISLTVSPVKTRSGRIVGASKIARDITERRLAQQQQSLLIREMSHRIKNLFALVNGLVTLSARAAATVQDLAEGFRARIAALARAHTMMLAGMKNDGPGSGAATTSLHQVIRAITSPYEAADGSAERFRIEGPDLALSGGPVTSFALLLHEFATNAAKYGALATQEGWVEIDCAQSGDSFIVTWRERGGPPVDRPPEETGFGTHLAQLTARGQLGGDIICDWRREGLVIRLTIDARRVAIQP